jgi:hypothetical protein
VLIYYTNDIVNAVDKNSNIRLFADDTNLFLSNIDPTYLKIHMKNNLAKLFAWCKCNKLTVNMSKTNYSIFSPRHKPVPPHLNEIKIDNHTIKREASAKYLGLILDENLTFQEHISEINKALIKVGNSFKIIKNYVPDSLKRMIYYAYVHSKIQYGIEVYGTAAPSHLKQTQRLQNRSIKILYNKDYFTPTLQLYNDTKILNIQHTYELSTLKFVHRQRLHSLPEIFDNMYTLNETINTYNTRQSNKIFIPRPKNNYGKKSIKYTGAVLWNQLPETIRSCRTITSFTSQAKTHIYANRNR